MSTLSIQSVVGNLKEAFLEGETIYQTDSKLLHEIGMCYLTSSLKSKAIVHFVTFLTYHMTSHTQNSVGPDILSNYTLVSIISTLLFSTGSQFR